MLADELLAGVDHGGKAALHVRGPAAVKGFAVDGGCKRIVLPLINRAGRHHVGMTGEYEQGPRITPERPQVVNLAEAVVFDREPERLQAISDDLLAVLVVGCNGRPADQLFCKFKR